MQNEQYSPRILFSVHNERFGYQNNISFWCQPINVGQCTLAKCCPLIITQWWRVKARWVHTYGEHVGQPWNCNYWIPNCLHIVNGVVHISWVKLSQWEKTCPIQPPVAICPLQHVQRKRMDIPFWLPTRGFYDCQSFQIHNQSLLTNNQNYYVVHFLPCAMDKLQHKVLSIPTIWVYLMLFLHIHGDIS